MPQPEPPPQTVFVLVPQSRAAREAVELPCNDSHVSRHFGDLVFHVRRLHGATINDCATLVNMGRNADITLPGTAISRLHCSFVIHLKTGMVMFYDKSSNASCDVSGIRTRKFQPGLVRRVVVMPSLNNVISIGHKDRNLVFELQWTCQTYTNTGALNSMRVEQHAESPQLLRTMDSFDASFEEATVVRRVASKSPSIEFEFVSPLGEGTFGLVDRVVDPYRGDVIACKNVKRPPGLSDDRWSMIVDGKFKREADIMRKLDHPNIIKLIYTEGWEEQAPRVYMPLQDGSLDSLLVDAKPERVGDIATAVFEQMLGALDYLASVKIVHRDVKPQNIFYRKKGDGHHFVLGDFGSSNYEIVASTVGVGTGLFMAPEMTMRGLKTHKADMWSLFVTIMWAANEANFRRAWQEWSSDEYTKQVWARALVSIHLTKIREMAIINPKRRASAAQMLDKLFDGKGISTDRREVVPFGDPEPACRLDEALNVNLLEGIDMPALSAAHQAAANEGSGQQGRQQPSTDPDRMHLSW